MTESTKLIICNQALTVGHFWGKDKAPGNGWILVQNLSTHSRAEVYFENEVDDYPQNTIKPLHTRPFRVAEGDQISIGHLITGQYVKIIFSFEKPNFDEYYSDEGMVENTELVGNVPVAGGVVVVNATVMQKGYATNAQITVDPAVAGSAGTVEISRDGAATYGPPIPLTEFAVDPLRAVLEITKVFTHLRITPTAGTLHYIVGG